MFDEERPKPKTEDFPRNLDRLSVDDLQEYVSQLEAEIARVKSDMKNKKDSSNAAAAFFK